MVDPSFVDREWYRHVTTGDRGFLVRRDGEDKIKMDRGSAPEDIRDFVASQWLRDTHNYPMVRPQLAQVAFAADKQLCVFLGLHRESKKEWRAMKEEDRMRFTEKGPEASELRQNLWSHIMIALRDLAK